MNHRNAFTLVELAIVLVIIGLIVGGVLVGQDLIKAAQIRSTISDIEKYNAATTTFREKYNGLPGDLLNTKAVQFGFNTTANDAARDGTPEYGDGDGEVTGCVSDMNTTLGCESALFWVDLSAAGLINFRAALDTTSAIAQASRTNSQLADGILPKSKLRDSALVALVSPGTGTHYFSIAEISTNWAANMEFPNGLAGGLTPLESSSIDTKLDDNAPMTGNIISLRRNIWRADATTGAQTGCMDATGEHYNTSTDTLGTANVCSISIRASF